MRAGSAGISNISGAWAAAPSVLPMCVANGIEKATGRMEREERGAGGGGDERMSGWADERGECWDLDCQRCMGCGSLGQIDVCGQRS
jgi:hypothetical protein